MASDTWAMAGEPCPQGLISSGEAGDHKVMRKLLPPRDPPDTSSHFVAGDPCSLLQENPSDSMSQAERDDRATIQATTASRRVSVCSGKPSGPSTTWPFMGRLESVQIGADTDRPKNGNWPSLA